MCSTLELLAYCLRMSASPLDYLPRRRGPGEDQTGGSRKSDGRPPACEKKSRCRFRCANGVSRNFQEVPGTSRKMDHRRKGLETLQNVKGFRKFGVGGEGRTEPGNANVLQTPPLSALIRVSPRTRDSRQPRQVSTSAALTDALTLLARFSRGSD